MLRSLFVPTNVIIPGVETVHQRQDWEPDGYRMDTDFTSTPPGLFLPGVDRGAIHYTAAIDIADGDPGEHPDGIRGLMRAITIDYYNNRSGGGYTRKSDGRHFKGFPFGYSFACDHWGGVWVGRGFDFRPAATGGHNGHTLPILMLTDLRDAGSELMWRSARMIMREANRRGGRLANEPWAHGWFAERLGYGTPTACCGAPLKAQLEAGYGNLDYDEGDGDMPAPTPLPAGPTRAYDSRPNAQDNITDPGLKEENKNVPLAPLKPGEPREIFVGLCSSAELNVTVVGRGGAGHVEVSPSRNTPKSSLVNFDAGDRVESNTGSVATPGGKVWLHTFVSECDIAVDVRGRG